MAELAALGAALCWALGTLLAADASRRLGGMTFTRVRAVMVLGFLIFFLTIRGFEWIAWEHWGWLTLSACIGIFIGDSALFVGLARLGPRRNSIMFATNAPMTAILSWFFLGEIFTRWLIVGSLLVLIGVIIAIVYGKRRDQVHNWETVQGSLVVGLSIGLLAALGQAVSSLLLAPVLSQGIDPVTVTAGRTVIAVLALYTARLFFPVWTAPKEPLNSYLTIRIAASGLLGMVIGMPLLMYAFSHGSIGLSAILSSTTPVMLLPLTWWISKERPAAGAWIGAILAVVGTALIIGTPI